MKKWTVTVFGKEVLQVTSREEPSLAEVVQHLVVERMALADGEEEEIYEQLSDGMIPCECCGEMFDPNEVDEEDEEMNSRFADIAEHLIWGPAAETDDDEKG